MKFIFLFFAFSSFLLSQQETRLDQYYRKAKGSGGKVQIVSATLIGTESVENVIGGVFDKNGKIIVGGNLWGPEIPEIFKATKRVEFGKGEFDKGASNPIIVDKKGKKEINLKDPNISGFIAKFSSDLSKVENLFLFRWKNASITDISIGPDGAIYFSGFITKEFKENMKDDKRVKIFSPPSPNQSRDMYVAKIDSDLKDIKWISIFENAEEYASKITRFGFLPSIKFAFNSENEIFLTPWNKIYCGSVDDPSSWKEIGYSKGGAFLGIDPKDDGLWFGGDNNTHTGREPWRRPFMYKIDNNGNWQKQLWGWDPKVVGSDKYRLVSDSAIRGLDFDKNKDIFVIGWSDGGNSVFTRQSDNLDEKIEKEKWGFIESMWGLKGAKSIGYIMKLDKETHKVKNITYWVAFLKGKNEPNSLQIKDLSVLEDGKVAVVGGSAYAVIPTPDAWQYTYLNVEPGSYFVGGGYFTIFSDDLKNLYFSTVLPYVDGSSLRLSSFKNKILITGIVSENLAYEGDYLEDRKPKKPFLKNALQDEYKGNNDGYVIVVEIGR
jgi:hypothetical protein